MRSTKHARRLRNIVRKLGNPACLVDFGLGHGGEESVLSSAFPTMACVGLEPNPDLFQHAARTFPGMVLPYAVWSENTALPFHLRRGNAEASSLFSRGHEADKAITVEARTLDWIDKHLGKPSEIVLWMDCEGAELHALQGGAGLLADRRILCISAEVRPEGGRPGACVEREVDSFLQSFGYQKVPSVFDVKRSHHDSIYVREKS